MKYKIHRSLAEQIREGCEGRLNIRLRAGWFSFGNVYPDVSHQRIMHMHEADSAGRMVDRMIRAALPLGNRERENAFPLEFPPAGDPFPLHMRFHVLCPHPGF